MRETGDIELLRQYAREGSEEAFETLMAGHVDLVYSAALRKTGNPHAAEEITQAVFIILAQKADKLRQGTILSGWLYQTARLTAANYLRTEIRRSRREQEACVQSLDNETGPEAWPQMAPLLEDAMGRLGAKDRDAIVLRFMEGKDFREIGAAFGASENAVKKRVVRALEKLRKFLAKRGVVSTAVVIGGAISTNSVHAAPAGLARVVSVAAAAKGAAAGGSTLALVRGASKLIAWTHAKKPIVVGVGILLAAGTATMVVKEVEKNRNHAPESTAFILNGYFEDVFAGKHQNAGSFMFRACGSDALVDVTFENGFREITGTDGRDTFTYTPFTGDKAMFKSWNGQATISHGRFPTNAHFFAQILWVVCVDNREFSSKLPNLPYSIGLGYEPGELTKKIEKTGADPDSVTSIRWYAPGYAPTGGSKTQYKLALYPGGWLKAELDLVGTTNLGKNAIPGRIIYNQYVMKGGSNYAEFVQLQKTITGPDDVNPVETCTFSVTNAQREQPLSSYVPQAWDSYTIVNDTRTQMITREDPQQWREHTREFSSKEQRAP
jgi:RNA polymerase sigma factor (sigma-70 family)